MLPHLFEAQLQSPVADPGLVLLHLFPNNPVWLLAECEVLDGEQRVRVVLTPDSFKGKTRSSLRTVTMPCRRLPQWMHLSIQLECIHMSVAKAPISP